MVNAAGARSHFHHARNEVNFGLLRGGGRCGTRQVFNDRHFPKNLAGPKLRKYTQGPFADQVGDFHQAVADDVNAIAGVVLREKSASPAG